MRLIGYDWEPKGVVLDTSWTEPAALHQKNDDGYQWQEGATKVGEAILSNTEPLINAEHALHVLEIIEAARKSSSTGTRVALKSSFQWPIT
jgi:predicted dehydrogenase